MNPWTLTADESLDTPECNLVRQWLREYNTATNPVFMQLAELPENQARPLAIFARVNSELVGGLLAQTFFAWLKISILSVSPDWQRKGIGRELILEAERIAIVRGCQFAYVDTFDYQSPQFYLKNGYEVAGKLVNWDSHGHDKWFFTKRLAKAIER